MIAYGPGEVRSLSLQVQEPPTIPHQPSYWTSSRSNQWTPFPGPSVKILQSPFLESQGTDIRLVLNLKPSFLDASSSEDGVQLPMHEGYSHMLWHGGEIIICSACNHTTLWNAFVNVQLHKPGPVPTPHPLPEHTSTPSKCSAGEHYNWHKQIRAVGGPLAKNPQQQQKCRQKINAHTHTQNPATLDYWHLISSHTVGFLRFHVKREEAHSWETIHSHLTRDLSARPPLGNLPAHSPMVPEVSWGSESLVAAFEPFHPPPQQNLTDAGLSRTVA